MTTRGPRAPGSTPSSSSRRASNGAGGAHGITSATSASDNLTYLRIVEQVTGSGITQEELGSAVGASLRSVQNWASGTAAPRGASRERLLDVKYIVEELRAAYTDEGIEIWLHARNRNLGGQRPIDLLTAGDVDTVVEEAQRVSGAM